MKALVPHRGNGRPRVVGEVYGLAPPSAADLIARSMVVPAPATPDWLDREGRDLHLAAPPCGRPVVACLSIWNDRAALESTWGTWAPFVDAVVVYDGPYEAMRARAGSTDGVREWIEAQGHPDVRYYAQVWGDQQAKRTDLLGQAGGQFPDALLFIVDADEFVAGAEHLRALPDLDVGWVAVQNPTIYQRRYGQPRVIRARPDLHYQGRHHWLYAGDALLATHQYGGGGFLHRAVPVGLTNARGLGHSPERAQAKRRNAAAQTAPEMTAVTSDLAAPSDRAGGAREALRVLQLTVYDAGLVCARLHTALNTTTPHASLLAGVTANNPFAGPTQYDVMLDTEMVQAAWDEADVVHVHLDYRSVGWIERMGRLAEKMVVIHHHGTMYREKPGPNHYNAVDPVRAGLRLVSNLELLRYGDGLHWLPNPMPVAQYQRLRAATVRKPGPFRVAHSPSKREYKGTEAFLSAVTRLHAEGVNVEAVLIERLPHGEALDVKAGCDAVFDSFWLGMQCSGLEGAAMGLPVVAGDADQREGYAAHGLAVPYTVANDEDGLVDALRRLATDAGFYRAEAERVRQFVLDWHDEARVALRLLNLYDEAFHWRRRLRVGMLKNVAPDPDTPKRKRPKRNVKPDPLVPAVDTPEAA